jgi:hypothetical protein
MTRHQSFKRLVRTRMAKTGESYTAARAQARVDGLAGGLVLGLVLWIGFPAVPWVGAIVHENIRWRLAAIHAGDWLVKLLAVGAVVSVWP